MKFLGVETFSINNYLFVFKSNNLNANKEFINFFKKWKINKVSQIKKTIKSNALYNHIIDEERKTLPTLLIKKVILLDV